MSVVVRSCPAEIKSWPRRLGLAAAAAAVVAGGCSADITRFDSNAFSLSENPSPISSETRRNAGAPLPFDDTASQPYTPIQPAAAPYTPPPARTTVAALPASPPPPTPAAAAPMPRPQPAVAAHAQHPVAKGEQIEVQQGDTLYGLSKRHHVSISELMAVNELKNPNLKPGQKLYLPATAKAAARPPLQRTASAGPAAIPAAAPVVGAPADWTGSYTIKPGESLYAIAHQVGVKAADLQAANGITDVRKVRPGTVLKVPGGSGSPAGGAVAYQHPASIEPQSAPEQGATGASAGSNGVTIINGTPPAAKPQQVAAAEPASTAAHPSKLRWPVAGRIIQGFGKRPDGGHNDGIDVAVPMGTDVLAAEAGVVAYAGNQAKTYGNLVLVRHENGWVTAYAYNEKILVQRGDQVKRGQPIAKAGKSGNIEQPQVHFELRVGAKAEPVDPTPYLEKL